jgi:hypothetical protein
METIKGGRTITVQLADGGSAEVFVRQLPLGDYEAAFLLQDDEMGLTALICGKVKQWVLSLEPESYETLRTASEEVNAKGFFVYASRQNERVTKRLNSVRPELLRLASEKASEKASLTSQPGLQPRA